MTDRTTIYSGEALHEFFGSDPDSYNVDLGDGIQDGSGRPAPRVSAIQFWCGQRGQDDAMPTVAEVGRVFNMPVEAVAQAVEDHPWMLMGGEPSLPLAERPVEMDGE